MSGDEAEQVAAAVHRLKFPHHADCPPNPVEVQNAQLHLDVIAPKYGTLGWNACAGMLRALIATSEGDTVSIFDIEDLLTAAEDEADDEPDGAA